MPDKFCINSGHKLNTMCSCTGTIGFRCPWPTTKKSSKSQKSGNKSFLYEASSILHTSQDIKAYPTNNRAIMQPRQHKPFKLLLMCSLNALELEDINIPRRNSETQRKKHEDAEV